MRSTVAKRMGWLALMGATWVCPTALHAQTAAFLSPPESSEIRELRVAHASSANRASLWFSLRLYGGADDVFAIVPAPLGATVDVSSDAWFEALSAATNPRVVPPALPPQCGTKPATGAVETIGVDDHVATLAPDSAVGVLNFAEVVLWAKTAGQVLTMEQSARLADLEVQGNRFVTLRFQPPTGESTTRTIRVSPTSQLSSVPLLLTAAGSARVQTTVWAFSAGRAWPLNRPGLAIDTSKLLWSAAEPNPQSNYGLLWDSMLANVQGHAWVVDGASHETLFRSTPISGGTEAVPAVGTTYFERAAGYGDGSIDFQGCAARFAALEWSHARVATACGRGDLIKLDPQGPLTCKEEPVAGETSPAELRCGKTADDLAIALSGSTPANMWLTRWTGYIPAWLTRDSEAMEIKTGPSISPVIASSGYDKPCAGDGGAGAGNQPDNPNPNDGGAGSGGQGSGSWGGAGGSYGGSYGGSTGGPGSSDPYPPEEGTCYDCANSSPVQSNVYVSNSCSGSSSSSSGDACSGDSSSSSGGDSCSSSSSSDSGGDSCSGDSNSGGDSCSGNSSDSGPDSCSGDSSSSSSGESCSGSSSSGGGQSCSGSSGGGSDCSLAKGGRGARRLPPLSGITLGIVALLLPLRRRWKRSP